ncbi:hypothetical protein V6N13_025289 [Hibiscus sabdariffa]
MPLGEIKIPNPGSVDLSFFPLPFSISSGGLFSSGLGAVDFPSSVTSSVFMRDIGRVSEDWWSQGMCGEGFLRSPAELSEDLRWNEALFFVTFSNLMAVKRWLRFLNGRDFSGIRLWRLPPREASSKCINEFSLEGRNKGISQTLELLWPFCRRAIQDPAPSVSLFWYALEFPTGGLLKYQVIDAGGTGHFWFFPSKTLGDGIGWMNGTMVYSSFGVRLWVSVSANLLIVISAVCAYPFLWLVVRVPVFFQSVLFGFLAAFFLGLIRTWLLCFIKFGYVMARAIVNLQFHLSVMVINAGILKLMDCFNLEVGDEVVRDFLSVVCDWGNLVLPYGHVHSYLTAGLIRDGAGFYPFGLVKVYVRLLETSLLCYKRLLSDYNFFHHGLKDFVKIWSDCFTT